VNPCYSFACLKAIPTRAVMEAATELLASRVTQVKREPAAAPEPAATPEAR
jgi:hypothetical protein